MTDGTREGRLSVWLAETAEADQIMELCGDLTADGQRLLILDAGDLLNPRRLSRLVPSAARSVQVMRMPADVETASFISGQLGRITPAGGSPRILLAGILDRLAGREMPARDMARELGRIKTALAALMDSGLDVNIACRIESGLRTMGPRAYFISSLCAMAHEIHRSSDPQQYIDRASAAIA
jgi:hypothetical protein